MAVLSPRQQQQPGPAPSSMAPGIPIFNPSTASNSKGMPSNTLAIAIAIPIVVVIGAIGGFLYWKQRKAKLALHGQTSGAAFTTTTPATTTTTTNTTANATDSTPRSRRDARRAARLRRTDSGTSVRTLPEYMELGEDEILLSKSADTPSAQSRNNSRSSRVGRTASRRDNESVSRESSIYAVLRRFSLRRSATEEPPVEDESNEMEDMLEGEPQSSVMREIAEPRMSSVREEDQATPTEDAPEYNRLYPSLPPQLQVQDDETDLEGQQQTSSSSRGARALRNIFRRQASPGQSQVRRNDVAATSTGELGLTQSRSIDLSLYRPSTSSSRRSFAFGSSISLLPQSNDTNARVTHIRNISAPISTKRLHLAPPAAGFSDQQMQFLTSVESLDKYGVTMSDSNASAIEAGPPSFEELAREEERALVLEQRSRHTAPILTTAEINARQDQPLSPLSPLRLPGQESTLDSTNNDPSTTS